MSDDRAERLRAEVKTWSEEYHRECDNHAATVNRTNAEIAALAARLSAAEAEASGLRAARDLFAAATKSLEKRLTAADAVCEAADAHRRTPIAIGSFWSTRKRVDDALASWRVASGDEQR